MLRRNADGSITVGILNCATDDVVVDEKPKKTASSVAKTEKPKTTRKTTKRISKGANNG